MRERKEDKGRLKSNIEIYTRIDMWTLINVLARTYLTGYV